MSQKNITKIEINLANLVQRYIFGNLIFFFKHSVLETTNRNILASIYIVNPQKRYDAERVDLVNKMLNYSIYSNEYLDVEKYVEKNVAPSVQKYYNKARNELEELEKTLLSSNNLLVHSFLNELNLFNNWSTSKDWSYWTPKRIKLSRELMNAFHTFAVYALLTNFSLKTKKCKTFRDIKDKYSWIIDNHPQGKDQTAVCILWNLAMVVQLADDIADFPVDEVCELPTYATVLNSYFINKLRPKNHPINTEIEKVAKKRIKEELNIYKDEYYDNARSFGYAPIIFQEIVFNTIFKTLKLLVRIISKLPRGIRYALSKRLRFLRERWRAEGRFD